MDFEVARQFIDYVLNASIQRSDAVVLDFIGGEPFLEIELIDRICDYFKIRTYEMGSQWYWNYRISICTNGVNYSDEKIRKFLEKNRGKISVSITVDGIKEKHDLQRVFPDGSGSYDVIDKNIDLWLEQFPGSTKVTFASEYLHRRLQSAVTINVRDCAAFSFHAFNCAPTLYSSCFISSVPPKY